MLRSPLFRSLAILAITIVVTLSACQQEGPAEPDTPINEWLEPTESVNGTLTEVQGIPLLTLWGTHYEQGFAHGYLLAPELIEYLDIQLSLEPGTVDFLENVLLPDLNIYTVPAEYLQEIEGFLAGMEARAGDSVYVASLDRYITLNDVIASTCIDNIQHLVGTNCTSFSAWDSATTDGGTITGRNYDQPDDEIHTGRYMLIVRKSPPGSGFLPWVSVNLPGALNGETGMNSEGVTFATQEVNQILPTSATEGFCPEFLLQRRLLESAHAASVVSDVSAVLEELHTNGGEAILMSWPSGNGPGAVVFEVDGDLTTGHGFTVRQPRTGFPFLIQTNQFYERLPFSHSERYVLLNARLVRILDGRSLPLTIEYAWELLGEVPAGDDILIQHAVVFEPDKMLMHVGFAETGTHATSSTPVTIDVAALLN